MRELTSAAIDRGAKLIFLDEAVFSPATVLKRSWSALNSNIEIKDLRKKVKTQACIAGISTTVGLESYLIKPRAIKQ
jgi:hypothetical protein